MFLPFLSITLALDKQEIFHDNDTQVPNPMYTYTENAPNGYVEPKSGENPVIQNMEIIKKSTAEALDKYLNTTVNPDNLTSTLQNIKKSVSLNGINAVKEGFYNAEPNIEGIKKYDLSLGGKNEGSYLVMTRNTTRQLIALLDRAVAAKTDGKTPNKDKLILDKVTDAIQFYDEHKSILKDIPQTTA